MLAAFQASLSPMLVMFLCIVSGYVLNRKKLCPANTGTVLSKLESNLLVPALVKGEGYFPRPHRVQRTRQRKCRLPDERDTRSDSKDPERGVRTKYY